MNETIDDVLADFTKVATKKIDSATTAAEDAKTKTAELAARLQHLEQKSDARRGGGAGSAEDPGGMATLLTADEGWKMVQTGRTKSTKIGLSVEALHGTKAAMTSVSSGITAHFSDRQPGIILPGQRRLTIRDLLPTLRTTAGSIEYVREAANVNGAATVAEGALKPESTVTMELVTANVATIATWLQASKQILDDVQQLQGYLDNRLRYMVRFAEEQQVLRGSGSGTNLLGLYTAATAYASPVTYASPTKIDVIRLALGQLEDVNYDANGIVLHPDDWTVIELLKNANGNYIKSNPADANVRALWGKPVVTTTSMAVGTFLVGDFPAAATLYDRQDPTLDIATQDQDDFVRNLIKLRVEERISLAVQLPGALVKGTFPTGA